MAGPTVGLCATCAFARVIENRSGSRFWLCQRSHTDPAFPRYPLLPVLACSGFGARPEAPSSPGAASPD